MKHEQTNIEWATYTFNPWRGCTKVSDGCENCYAETLSKRNPATLGEWGPGKPRVLAAEAMWRSPIKWNAAARDASREWHFEKQHSLERGSVYQVPRPERPRVFCASLGDWLDDEVPIEWLWLLMDLIRDTPHLDWLLLTKRPENWAKRLGAGPVNTMVRQWLEGSPPANVWLGTSVEDQTTADIRIPQLLRIPAKVRFLSCEPLLGPVNFHSNHIKVATWNVGESFDGPRPLAGIHWVIAGGESGGSARPMHPAWVRSLRDQCRAANVPFLFKQWGEFIPAGHPLTEGMPIADTKLLKGHRFHDDTLSLRVGKKYAGRTLDGQIHHAFPQP